VTQLEQTYADVILRDFSAEELALSEVEGISAAPANCPMSISAQRLPGDTTALHNGSSIQETL